MRDFSVHPGDAKKICGIQRLSVKIPAVGNLFAFSELDVINRIYASSRADAVNDI